ncbi:MAG: His/Gly/Thr/Pro-type tRNA ligase C-terminal domain-containing protein [Minisyncoccia bacterium]
MSKQTKDRPSYLLKEFDKPLYIASHFGFIPTDSPKITDADLKQTDEFKAISEEKVIHDAAEKAAFLRTYMDKGFTSLPHPLSIAYRKSEPGKRTHDYCLHILGYPQAMAEAILIRTALSILEEIGHKKLVVEINTIGDKDSIASYERELSNYAKKIASDLDIEHKKRLKDSMFELLKINLPENSGAHIPPSIASLTAQSRAHFKEMLECLEHLNVDFRLAHTLIGNPKYNSHTIFAIRDLESDCLLASGARYSRLTKKIGFKKELPAVSITIFDNAKKAEKEGPRKTYNELPKPRFYLIQLGCEAKLKALPLIELLRSNRIPVHHFLGRDKLTAQLASAESFRVPYLLILGQKEALDNTVTIRNVSTRAQETIAMPLLVEYLKHIAL